MELVPPLLALVFLESRRTWTPQDLTETWLSLIPLTYTFQVGGGASGGASSTSSAAELMRGDDSLQLVIKDGSFSWGKVYNSKV